MRTASVALVLLCLCVSIAAKEPATGTRILNAKIVRAGPDQVIASASVELADAPGSEYELLLSVRIPNGEFLKTADGETYAVPFGRVTMPDGKATATFEDRQVTIDPGELLRSPNLPDDRLPLRLLIEISLWQIAEGKRIAAAPVVSTPLEIYRGPDDTILRVEHMGTWRKAIKGPVDDAVLGAARALLVTYGESIPDETRRQALTALVSLFGNDDLKDQVLDLMTALGEQAVKALARGLESPEPMVRAWCGICLLQHGTYGRGATLALFEGMRLAIQKQEAYALRTLANALEKINPRAIGAAEVLSIAIEDPTLRLVSEDSEPDTIAVCAAIAALSKLGVAARPAIPILQRALTDPDAAVRTAAKAALNKLNR